RPSTVSPGPGRRAVVATRSRLALPTTQTSKSGTSAGGAGADADRRDQAVAGSVSLVLALAAPEAVLVLVAGERPARGADAAGGAHLARRRFSAFTRLRSFRRTREEQVRQALAGCLTHPVVV